MLAPLIGASVSLAPLPPKSPGMISGGETISYQALWGDFSGRGTEAEKQCSGRKLLPQRKHGIPSRVIRTLGSRLPGWQWKCHCRAITSNLAAFFSDGCSQATQSGGNANVNSRDRAWGEAAKCKDRTWSPQLTLMDTEAT